MASCSTMAGNTAREYRFDLLADVEVDADEKIDDEDEDATAF